MRSRPRDGLKQQGFTLVEVLVTMFVIAIGLLAAAGLQAISKKINYDAVQRTGATQSAQAMVERLRGNSGQLAAYVTTDAGAVASAVDCAADAAACSEADLVAYDLRQWGRSLSGAEETVEGESVGGLVAPTGCISATETPNLYVVAVAWRGVTGLDPSDDDPDSDCGLGLGRYDDPAENGVDERLRRVILIQAFVADPYAG